MDRNHRDLEAASGRGSRRRRHSCPNAVGLLVLLAAAGQGCQSSGADTGGTGGGGERTSSGGTGGGGTGGIEGGAGRGGAGGDGGATAVLGHCFEIFPSLENAGPDASPVMYHVNPLDLNLGTIASGAAAAVSISYYNFCGDPDAILLGVELSESPAAGASGPCFAIARMPAVGAHIQTEPPLRVTFSAKTTGPHEAIVHFRVPHGEYVTRIKAVVN